MQEHWLFLPPRYSRLSGRKSFCESWFDLIDFDEGKLTAGGADIGGIGEEFFQKILAVASGRTSPALDISGLVNDLEGINPARETEPFLSGR